MRIRLALGGAMAVLAACLAIQWQAREGVDVEPAPAAAAAPAARPPAPVAALPVAAKAAAPTAAPASQVRWRELEDKFEKSRNLRAFYYEVVQRPQDGGFYYANKALGLCKVALGAAPATEAARQAQAALRERCDLSAQDHEDAWRHFSAIRGAGLTDDPLLRQTFGFLMAQSDGARLAALQAAVDLGNPEVAGSLLASAMAKDAAVVPPDRSEHAMLLVQCRLGADCGADSVVAQVLCARDGWCGGGVQDALRNGLGAEFARIDGMSQRAVAALRRGELASLLPKQPSR